MNRRIKEEKCELCQQKFGLRVKQHQCKRCLSAICYDCGKEKSIVVHYDLNKTHRVCHKCKSEQDHIQSLIIQNNVAFGQSSLIQKRWFKYLYLDIAPDPIDENVTYILDYVQVQSMISEIIQSYNYSLREFHHYSTTNSNTNISNSVASVLQLFLQLNPSLQLSTQLCRLTLFLLYFTSTTSALQLLNYIYHSLLPDHYKCPQSPEIKEQEIQFLLQIATNNYLIPSADLIYLRNYLQSYAHQMLTNLLLTSLSFSCTYYLYDHLFKFKDFYELQKVVVLIANIHLKVIKSHGLHFEYLHRHVLNFTYVQDIKTLHSNQDRIKSKNIHSKSEDVFNQSTSDNSIIQIIHDIIVNNQSLNNAHKHIISKLTHSDQAMFKAILNTQSIQQVVQEENTTPDDLISINSESTSHYNQDIQIQECNNTILLLLLIVQANNKKYLRQIQELEIKLFDLKNQSSKLTNSQSTQTDADQSIQNLMDQLNTQEQIFNQKLQSIAQKHAQQINKIVETYESQTNQERRATVPNKINKY